MAIKSIASVKSHFETGDRPTQGEFADLIDTAARVTPIAIASAAEGGKTGIYEILGDGDVTARAFGAFGRSLISSVATASAHNALGITSVQSIFLAAETTASSQSLLGISSHQVTFLLSGSTASSQSILGGGTAGIAVFEAASTASAQESLGIRVLTSGTTIATTSGTAHDFTGIPSWVQKITVSFAGVSLSGTDQILIQIGDSGGVETSGYLGGSSLLTGATTSANSTAGYLINVTTAASVIHGSVTLTLVNAANNTWAASGVVGRSDGAATIVMGGLKSLSAALDRVRITRSGTDTFDAGSVNVLYE